MSHRQNIWIMVKAQTLWWGFVFVFFGGGGVATSGYKLLFMACLIHFERMCAKKFSFLFASDGVLS